MRFGCSLPAYNVTWGLERAHMRASVPETVPQKGKYRRRLRSIGLELAFYYSFFETTGGTGLVMIVVFRLASGCLATGKETKEAWSILEVCSGWAWSKIWQGLC